MAKSPVPIVNDTNASGTLFLPDFCNIRMVFAIVIIAELLAFLIVLASSSTHQVWDNLSLTSLFIQWVALASTAVLCLSRPWLATLDNRVAALFSYLLPVIVTALLSGTSDWIAYTQMDAGAGQHADFAIRNITISAIVSAVVMRYFYVQHQLKQNIQAESRARIQALQARIRPHFLFNSMNTIASLTRSQPALAEEAVMDLADLFRVSLSDAQELITFQAELELSQRYLHIEKLRLGERLIVEWDLHGISDSALIPALTLQPLLENAIYHGIEPLPEGGVININGQQKLGLIHITISNPVSTQNISARRGGHHMALDNIRQRLAAHYGTQGTLATERTEDHYHVRITFPVERSP